VRHGLAQRRQPGAIGQHDRLGKTQGPGHDATPATEPGFKPDTGGLFRESPRLGRVNGSAKSFADRRQTSCASLA
jgi:hypothetical protein